MPAKIGSLRLSGVKSTLSEFQKHRQGEISAAATGRILQTDVARLKRRSVQAAGFRFEYAALLSGDSRAIRSLPRT